LSTKNVKASEIAGGGGGEGVGVGEDQTLKLEFEFESERVLVVGVLGGGTKNQCEKKSVIMSHSLMIISVEEEKTTNIQTTIRKNRTSSHSKKKVTRKRKSENKWATSLYRDYQQKNVYCYSTTTVHGFIAPDD